MTTNDPEVCHTCKNSRTWHLHFKPRHPFNDGSAAVSDTFGKRRADGTNGPAPAPLGESEGPQRPSLPPMPFDPVLRQALINKGVLTPEDLRAAEEQIRAVTAAFHQERGGDNGQ